MRYIDGIAVFGEPEAGAMEQARNCLKHESVMGMALMADNHKGYAVPIGGVVAYEEHVSPSGVGYDIGCGNKAVKTDMKMDPSWVAPTMDAIYRNISFGMGRKNAERVDHELFDDDAWSLKQFGILKDKAVAQLGTVGSGNHYVDLLEDEEGWLWIGVHFGSRGFGHGVATWALKAGGAVDAMDSDPLVIPVDGDLGAEYIAGMNLAGRYAYAGRDWVCQKVASMLGANIVEEVHNHHNFAWQELAGVWVVRKGATPAYPGQRSFVGGSMGDDSVILEGASLPITAPAIQQALDPSSDEQLASYYSTIHGAGRVMSRTQARGKIRRRKVNGRWQTESLKPGLISREDMEKWLKQKGVVLRGGGMDEAPQAYKRLPEVIAAQGDTIRVIHTLRPLGVAMAGENEFDPYKD